MGAHPQATSEVFHQGRWMSLGDLIREAPAEILGDRVAERFGGELPFLFKVLAAAEPLSIQAHPDRAQARRGFRREDETGVGRDAPQRNYRDPNHKPELLCALTRFAMVRGFRPPGEIFSLLERLGLPQLLPECRVLRGGEASQALERFFADYMMLSASRLEEALEPALARASELEATDAAFRWVGKLATHYPGDRGALAPLILNFLELQPGEAVFTGPGVLHAYLDGVGVELMASSDNVLRGGLTSKHVDVPELLEVLRFEPQAPRILNPVTVAGIRSFETAAEEFVLEELEVTANRDFEGAGGSVAILLCTEGEGSLRAMQRGSGATGTATTFARGDTFLIPAAAPGIRISGSATLFRASVGSTTTRKEND